MSYYMHKVPGRLRVKTPLIKGKEQTAKHVETFLRQVQGIVSIATNPLTGSITITYDEKKITADYLLTILQSRGIFDISKATTNDQYITSTATKAGNIVYKAVLGAVVESALEGSALSLLAVFI
ncbi:MAG: HMA2 domain-containing protein [Nitrospirota bacterium]